MSMMAIMTRIMPRWMSLAIALALGGGCGKGEDPGPSCAKVADHVSEVARKAFPGHGEMMPASSRKSYIASCETRKLTGKQRRCMLEAQSIEALAQCMPKERPDEKKPETRPGTPPPGAAAPAAPAPAAPAPATPSPAPQ